MSRDASASSVQCGAVIGGKFRVLRILGEGGMGVVLLAQHLDLDRPVAIKVVRDELAQNDAVVRRMLLEARVAASLRSEHVARVLDIGRVESGAPYIVMEYLEGCDLGALLAQLGPIPANSAVSFLLQACEAVAEAHVAGIVHRDLKPENLFLTARADGMATIKVLDFGISKSVYSTPHTALTNPSTAVGSPDYMSPEQMSATGVDARSDIWSLGAILYELLTGRTPFAAESVPAVCARVLRDVPVKPSALNPDVPDRLEQIVLRCLKKDPHARYESVAELAQELSPFGSNDSTEYAARVVRVSSCMRAVPTSAVELWRAATGSIEAPSSVRRRSTGSYSPSVLSPGRRVHASGRVPARHSRKRWYLAACAFAGLVLPAAMLELTPSPSSDVPIVPEPRRGPVPEVAPMSGRNEIAPAGPEPESPRVEDTETLLSVDERPDHLDAEEPPRKTSSRRKSSLRPAGSRRLAAGAFAGKSAIVRPEPQPPGAEPAVTAPAKTVAPESSTTVPQRLDAWNTDTFGGRR